MVNEEIKKKYSDVQGVLDEALGKANAIKITGEKENAELSEIKKTLELLNADFKKEIDKLENATEWDKFCIAFFGETNAGKSTIIETLRIIYDEETRRAEALAQEKEYHERVAGHCEEYRGLISTLAELNVSLQNHSSKSKWIWYVVACVAGVVVGLFLGIAIW